MIKFSIFDGDDDDGELGLQKVADYGGYDLIDPEPVKQLNPGLTLIGNPTIADCSCFSGTAYRDAAGACSCHPNASLPGYPFKGSEAEQIAWRNEHIGAVNPIETPPPNTGGVKPPPGMKWTPSGWVPIRTVSTTKGEAAANDDGTILGFSPWVILGAGAVGLWMLSTMDTGKK